MRWRDMDGEDMFVTALGAWIVLLLLGATIVGAWAAVHEMLASNERNAAKERCGINGGRVEYSPAPHESDWRCVGAGAERAP
jgi:hypothetical protein